MATYRERREARAERLREWAASREGKARAEYETAHERAEVIPFGQPILVGHHSERRDRNYRERIARGFERSFEHANKARQMEGRADTIERQLEEAIYDDDPDALERLRAKLDALEDRRAEIKRANKRARAEGQPAAPAYLLSNLGGQITRTRQRIARLEARQRATGSTAKPARLLQLRYAGTCGSCGIGLEVGTLAYYDRAERAVTCRPCHEGIA